MKNQIHFNSKVVFRLLLLLFIVVHFQVVGQEGSYLISKHTPSGNNNINFDIAISEEGNIFIATKNGVIKYNGQQQKILDIGGAALSIVAVNNSQLFVGGVNGFGSIETKGYQEYYTPIVNVSGLVINQLLYLDKHVYAISDNILFDYNIEEQTTLEYEDNFSGQFYQLFELNEKVYISSEYKGILELNGSRLESTDEPALLDIGVNFAKISPNGTRYLIGTFENKVFLYEKGKIVPIEIDHQFFNENTFSSAVWLDNDKFAIGSIYNGIVIVDVTTGSLTDEINFNSGLSANKINTLVLDKNGNILSLSDNIIEFIALKFPIKNMGNYPGISGHPNALSMFQNTLYVATDIGLYSLEKVNEYEQQVVNIPITANSRQSVETKRKRWFSKNKRKRDSIASVIEAPRTKKITKQVVVSTRYAYSLVENISSAKQFLLTSNSLLVAGLSGIYEVKNNVAQDILREPIYYSYLSKDKSVIIACGDNEIFTLVKENENWKIVNILSDLHDNISHIVEYDDSYWLCGTKRIHHLKINDNKLVDVEIFELNNPYFDNIYAFVRNDSLQFLSKNSKYNFISDSIVGVKQNQLNQIVLDSQNDIWVKSGNAWLQPQNNNGNHLLSLFNSISYIYISQNSDDFWVILDNGALLQVNSSKPVINNYSPYLDAIQTSNAQFLDSKNFELDQINNKLSFQVAHPDLANFQNTMFRHRLMGLDNKWTEWSMNDLIEFSFLPAGNYVLELQAKNSFGNVFEIPPVKFKVIPPYWKEPIFFLFEFLVIVALLFASVKFRKLGGKFKVISMLLAFLVLAVTIEGLQTLMESYFNFSSSPFFSFSMQVLTALILFPLEGFFRKYILQEKGLNKIKEHLEKRANSSN